MTFDDAVAPHQVEDRPTLCPVCGVTNFDRPHTFNVCNTNLRALLKSYYKHVIEAEGDSFLEWTSADGEHRNMTDEEIRFVRGL